MIFEGRTDGTINLEDFDKVCTDVSKIPKIFKKILFENIKKLERLDEKADKLTKQNIVSYFKREFLGIPYAQRVFKILAQKDPKFIQPDDFKELFKYLLDTPPGLEFL